MPGKRGISSGGFDVQLLFAHKILLATIVIAFVGWWVAFIGQCVAENDVTAQSQLWFAILLHLALIIGFIICIATDSLPLARLQLVAFTAVALVLAARGTNGVYIGASSEKAVGAGYILLLIVDLIWLLYLTSEEGSPFYSILNITNTGVTSPAARDTSRYGGGGSNAPLGGGGGSGNVGDGYNARNNTSGYSNNFNTGSGYQPAYGHSAADITNGDGMGAPKLSNVSMRSRGGADTSNGGVGPTNDAPSVASHGVGLATAGSGPGSVGGTAEYGYKARALYAYQANADDPTEISFTKGEILDIVDNSGKWWQAKKASGETGIVPSNYMQLL